MGRLKISPAFQRRAVSADEVPLGTTELQSCLRHLRLAAFWPRARSAGLLAGVPPGHVFLKTQETAKTSETMNSYLKTMHTFW